MCQYFISHVHVDMATHSSTLVWRILCTEQPGGLQSLGSPRVRHDWSDWTTMQVPSRTTQKMRLSISYQEDIKQPGLGKWSKSESDKPGREESLGENGSMYMHVWVPLLSIWNYHNIVNLLRAVLCLSVLSESLDPWTIILQAPWGFSRQEYWSGLPCPPPADLPNPGIRAQVSLHCRRILYYLSHQGSQFICYTAI